MKLKTITVKLTIISCYNNNIKGKEEEEVIEKGDKAKRKRLNGKRNKVKDENKKMMNIKKKCIKFFDYY